MSSSQPDVPEWMSADARKTWPHPSLVGSWLGDVDLDGEWRPGEDSGIDPDDPEALAAARRFRDVLSRFASGVTVVTSISGGQPVGLTCQSFSSVSLDPPLVLFVPARTSRAWPLMQRAGTFCVNFLAHDQTGLSDTMASRGVDKFADLAWSPSPVTGSPLFDGTLGHVDCAVHAVHEAGDHYVVIGRVLELDAGDVGPGDGGGPLLFFEGGYHTTGD